MTQASTPSAPSTPYRPVRGFRPRGGQDPRRIASGHARALLEVGVEPDVILGTSVGAVNGAFLVADPTASGGTPNFAAGGTRLGHWAHYDRLRG
jgi:hypothetical protein